MKNIYSPYSSTLENEFELHLELNKTRQKFLFIFYKILPFVFVFLGIMCFYLMLNKGEKIFGVVFFVLLLTCSIIYACSTYIIGLEISRNEIIIYKNSLIKNITILRFSTGELQKIIYKLIKGKGGGAYYYLLTKKNKKVKFFIILLHDLHDENVIMINQKFANILGIPIET